MNTTILSIIVLVCAYLIGSIPVGLWLVRITTGKDVRQVGSGRIGGTNVLRAAGPWVALTSVIGDVLKGLLPVLLARRVVGIPAVEASAGLLTVLGHNYSIFIGFKGGAGTMTTIGSTIALCPWLTAIVVLVGLPTLIIIRYASLASITVALLIPTTYMLWAWLGNGHWAYLIHGLGTATLTLWSLRPNIKRLRAGNERRVTFRKSPEPNNTNTSE
ncbi:MAG: glycerol-3-phosphate 1-O-acyltransferase PlsY [Chloroflexi bacterium]|nr:glycerol-3-phosphate 1-O-acyltransferase PlsY [Chloroflexota bacterium]